MSKPNDTNDRVQHHSLAVLHRTATRSRVTLAAYWMYMAVWMWLRHPISMAFRRIIVVRLAGNTWASVLHVYGNFEMRAYSGLELPGVSIEGDAESLRRLAVLLLDRADRVDAVQAQLDAGVWPNHDDRASLPAGFDADSDSRLGNAVLGRETGGAR